MIQESGRLIDLAFPLGRELWGKIIFRGRPERLARNPSTGQQVQKPTDQVVKIAVAKAVKDSINT